MALQKTDIKNCTKMNLELKKSSHDSTDSGTEEPQQVQDAPQKQPLLSLPSDHLSLAINPNECFENDTSDCCIDDISNQSIDDILSNENDDEDYKIKENNDADNSSEVSDSLNSKLNTKWTMYFRCKDTKEKKEQEGYQPNQIQKLCEINTIKEFWQMLNHMTPPSNIQKRMSPNLMFFRENILPEWEDKENSDGGLWSFSITGRNLREKLNEMWYETLMHLIGEQIIYSEYITGVYLQKRQREDRIQLWTKNAPNDIQKAIGKSFKNILVSLIRSYENCENYGNINTPELNVTSNPLNNYNSGKVQNTRFDRLQNNSRTSSQLQNVQEINMSYIKHNDMKNIQHTHRSNSNNKWNSTQSNNNSRQNSTQRFLQPRDLQPTHRNSITINNQSNSQSSFFSMKNKKNNQHQTGKQETVTPTVSTFEEPFMKRDHHKGYAYMPKSVRNNLYFADCYPVPKPLSARHSLAGAEAESSSDATESYTASCMVHQGPDATLFCFEDLIRHWRNDSIGLDDATFRNAIKSVRSSSFCPNLVNILPKGAMLEPGAGRIFEGGVLHNDISFSPLVDPRARNIERNSKNSNSKNLGSSKILASISSQISPNLDSETFKSFKNHSEIHIPCPHHGCVANPSTKAKLKQILDDVYQVQDTLSHFIADLDHC